MRFYRGLQPFKVMSFDLDDTLYDNNDVIRLAEETLSSMCTRTRTTERAYLRILARVEMATGGERSLDC